MPSSGEWRATINWPFDAPRLANYRMLGVADFARAIATGTAPRASGALALHVLEIMEGILASAGQGAPVTLAEADVRPAALGEAEAASLHEG